MMRRLVIAALLWLAAANLAHAQQSQSVSQADKGTFTEGSSKSNPAMGVVNDSRSGDCAEDRGCSLRTTPKGDLHVVPFDSGGTDASDTTNHAVRVNVVAGGGAGGTSSSYGAAFPGTGTAIGAKNGANMVNLTADGSSNLNVNCAAGCAAASANDANGALGALNAAVTLDNVGGGATSVQILTGTLVGTVTPEVSNDNATWVAANFIKSDNTVSATVNAFPFLGHVDATGWRYVRVRVSAYTSGTSNGFLHTTPILSQSAQLPAALVGGRMDTNNGAWMGSTAPTVGSKTSANSIPVVVASDQGAIAVNNTQQGTASQNVAQFGGTNVSTGTGAGGAGIPRVTISNDSSLAANQSVNLNQVGGSSITLGQKTAANSVPVALPSDQATVTAPLAVRISDGSGFRDPDLSVAHDAPASAINPMLTGGYSSVAPPAPVSTDLDSVRSWYLPSGVQTANVRDSAGREVGNTLPSGQSAPLQVTVAPSLTQIAGVIRNAPVLAPPASGAILPPNVPPASNNIAQVVAESPNPSLQCPYVVAISQTASTRLVANPGGKSIHICTFGVINAAAQSLSLVEGTGSTCGTGTRGLYGGASASAAFAANAGVQMTSDRIQIPMQNLGDDVCLLQSAANNISGILTYGLF